MLESKALYRAIGKSMLARYSVYFVNLASMMILARIFTPETFGIVASIAVFLNFFQLMAEAGLGPAIINRDKLTPKERDGIFSLTLTSGLMLGLAFYLLAPVFESFYGIFGVSTVVPFVAIALFFFAASIVPNAVLLRQQSFYRIAIAGFMAEFVSTAGAIALSFKVDPLHALAAKGSISAATTAAVVWVQSANTEFGRPSLGKNFAAIKPLLNFSGYQFGFNFINYFSRNLDNILLGKYMGASVLGMYEKAYHLMRYPLMLLTFAMTPAIQPVIREHASDRVKIEQIHRDFVFKLSLIGAVAGLGMFILADWMILLVLGNQWLDVVPIIRILSIAIPVQVVLSTSGSFFQAMNRVDLLFISGFLSAVVMISAIIIGIVARDVELLCWCLVAAFHINFLQAYYHLQVKVLNAGLSGFLFRIIPAGVVVLGMIFYSLRME
jgi:O-antigen/teichoic acid export membrane protein